MAALRRWSRLQDPPTTNRFVGRTFRSDNEAAIPEGFLSPGASGAKEPKSLCEYYNSSPVCVAPTVLRIPMATVPSPYGLG